MFGFKRLYRHTAETNNQQRIAEGSWWENRLIPYIETNNIHTREQLDDLTKRYIPTLKTLRKLCPDAVFVALDIKPVLGVLGVFEVNLALLPELHKPTAGADSTRPSLEEFVLENDVKAVSLKIKVIGRDDDAKLRANSALVKALNKFCESIPSQKLALMGFSLQKDIESMGLNFAEYIKMFPRWINPSRMIEATSPGLAGLTANIRDILNTFGYVSTTVRKFGYKRVFINEAVKALAVLDGLQYWTNIDKLVVKERKLPGIEVEARAEAFRFMPYKANVHRGGSSLPFSINSAHKLAVAIQDYRPIGVAADISDPQYRQFLPCFPGVYTVGITRGCVCFKDEEALEKFVKDFDGRAIDGVTIKVEKVPHQPFWKLVGEYLKTKGTSLRGHLELVATSARENRPRWSELFATSTERLPWCPNPEDAPPRYYDTDNYGFANLG
ncbi:uncharacterized protein F4812DRAFT_123457 [Daldinia caldariorum]|uniref:uncharacterized protein n=1 Tax=Daldinia caldariorum TaxID=326644 RepID=UPI00200878EA|nr:uncharacterized protein F4812DRAFT_123457 [Daldinia caldariorum]KAI1465443.1 hypothetical protein F4812DRAFT_123457 [Daldinia caldariorum]